MSVYTVKKVYKTKAFMGMVDITNDFKDAVTKSKLSNGIITGFVAGVSAALTTLEYEPGLVTHDLKYALDKISPFEDANGKFIDYKHHKTWGCNNGSSHIKAALLSPSITVPFVDQKLTIGPWQNFALVECDTTDRERNVIYQIIGN
jgi:secondary thiamine-phosphate synthase enzyme